MNVTKYAVTLNMHLILSKILCMHFVQLISVQDREGTLLQLFVP